MRTPILVLTALLGPLLAGAPATAAPMPFTGELTIFVGSFPAFETTIQGRGVAEVGGAPGGLLTSLSIPAAVFTTTVVTPVPNLPPLAGIRATASNGPGAFSGLTGSGGGGSMALTGSVIFCLFSACDQPGLDLVLPLSVVGVGGTAVVTGPITITVQGGLWTQGTTTVSTPFLVTILRGSGQGPASQIGSTAQPGGRVHLVTPIAVATTFPDFEQLNAFGELTIHFVPEPGPSWLIATGVAALGVWRRLRRSQASSTPSPRQAA